MKNKPGRPTKKGVKMTPTAVYLLPEQIDWLKRQDRPMGETIRLLIQEKMTASK